MRIGSLLALSSADVPLKSVFPSAANATKPRQMTMALSIAICLFMRFSPKISDFSDVLHFDTNWREVCFACLRTIIGGFWLEWIAGIEVPAHSTEVVRF